MGAALAAIAALAIAVVAVAAHVPFGGGHLTAVGPVSATDGFPVWYEDGTGLKTSLCLDGDDPLCGFLPGDIPDPTEPISFPDNFPEEAFYMLAGAGMDTAGGRATNVLALEAAFATAIQDGDQMVFGRVRHRIDGLQPGATYRITHPYGQDIEVADATGVIRFTEDIGTIPGAFGEALNSRIGPFLRWTADAPPGYLGDPAVEHQITGSPFGTNVFRVEGPGAGAPGAANLCQPAAPEPTDCIETDLFTLQGKISTNEGVDVARVTYSTTPGGDGTLDVFAGSSPFQSIEASGPGFDPTRLVGDGDGHYFARVAYSGPTPGHVAVTNVGDTPVATKEVVPADRIDATATYDTDAATLTIRAASSDQGGNPALTAVGYGGLVGGELVVSTPAPPSAVVVRSAAGGAATVVVVVDGGAFAPIPVQAFAGPDQLVAVDATVELDGSRSTGPVESYSWVQTSGSSVALTGADTATPTFTAPATPETLSFELTVEGPGGPSIDAVDVEVVEGTPAPVANAGPDQPGVTQATVVTLDGSASSGGPITSYSWTQTAGPSVSLGGASTATPSFTAPKAQATFTFELTVAGPGGASTDTVTVATAPDVLTVAQAEYRTSSRQWRIRGTSSVVGPGVVVTIHNGPSAEAEVLATAEVDAVGDWQFRQSSSAAPPTGTSVFLVSSSGGTLFQQLTRRN